jgi:hypothetical protein
MVPGGVAEMHADADPEEESRWMPTASSVWY